MRTRRLRLLVTIALIASASLFAIGVAIERNSKHHERTGEPHAALGGRFLFAADVHPGEAGSETSKEHRRGEKPGTRPPQRSPGVRRRARASRAIERPGTSLDTERAVPRARRN